VSSIIVSPNHSEKDPEETEQAKHQKKKMMLLEATIKVEREEPFGEVEVHAVHTKIENEADDEEIVKKKKEVGGPKPADAKKPGKDAPSEHTAKEPSKKVNAQLAPLVSEVSVEPIAEASVSIRHHEPSDTESEERPRSIKDRVKDRVKVFWVYVKGKLTRISESISIRHKRPSDTHTDGDSQSTAPTTSMTSVTTDGGNPDKDSTTTCIEDEFPASGPVGGNADNSVPKRD